MALRLPDPMLTRPSELPLRPGYVYEVKWDGFPRTCLDALRVRSRRGWDMTERVSELAALPEGSFSTESRILHGHDAIAITYVIFDVLAYNGEGIMALASERPTTFDRLGFEGTGRCTSQVFDDGERLFAAVVEQALEGIVAKPLSSGIGRASATG